MFSDTNADTGAGGNKATGSAMMDLISGLQKNKKGSTTSGGDTTVSLSELFKRAGEHQHLQHRNIIRQGFKTRAGFAHYL